MKSFHIYHFSSIFRHYQKYIYVYNFLASTNVALSDFADYFLDTIFSAIVYTRVYPIFSLFAKNLGLYFLIHFLYKTLPIMVYFN